MLHGVEAACDALNKDSGGMLEKLTAGIAARTSAIIERARQSGDAACVQLAEEAGAWATTHYWGSRLQLWCPAMDALEGVREHGQESARHMAYRGVIAGAVDEALKEAARAARALARKEAAGSGGLAELPPSPDHPRTRVHTALADAAVCTARAVRDTLRAWAHRAAASAGVVAVDTGAGGAAGAGAAGEGDARARQVQERQAKAAAAEGERKAGGDPTKDLKRCSGRMCDARSAACQGWAARLILKDKRECGVCTDTARRSLRCGQIAADIAAQPDGLGIYASELRCALRGDQVKATRVADKLKQCCEEQYDRLPQLSTHTTDKHRDGAEWLMRAVGIGCTFQGVGHEAADAQRVQVSDVLGRAVVCRCPYVMDGRPNQQRVAQCDKCNGWRDGGRMQRTGCEGCEPAARNIKCDLCQGKVCVEHTTRTGQPRLPPDDFIELQRAAAAAAAGNDAAAAPAGADWCTHCVCWVMAHTADLLAVKGADLVNTGAALIGVVNPIPLDDMPLGGAGAFFRRQHASVYGPSEGACYPIPPAEARIRQAAAHRRMRHPAQPLPDDSSESDADDGGDEAEMEGPALREEPDYYRQARERREAEAATEWHAKAVRTARFRRRAGAGRRRPKGGRYMQYAVAQAADFERLRAT